ncbi:MAG: DNA repair protein RecN [Lachnospiraceae bacterium]|nr:DNA repair protein RecN [Lachnospiraceae bacterium]
MLISLGVKNLALIRSAELEFGSGLNILTGETGAGKSLVIGSVNLALGGRADKDIVRSGESEADIELVFSLEGEEVREMLRQLDIPDSDGDILVLRRIIRSGRSTAKVNGQTVTAATLKAVSEAMIDIHGQHEHQSLLYRASHRRILDEYAGEEMASFKEQAEKACQEWKNAERLLSEMPSDENARKRQADLLRYELEEIDRAALKEGEDLSLEEEFTRMKHARKLTDAMGTALSFAGGEGRESASVLVGYAAAALKEVADLDPRVKELSGEISEIESLLSDFCMDAGEYLRSMEFSEEQFTQVQTRLDEINRLKAKYGSTIAGIMQSRDQKEMELKALEEHDSVKEELLGKRDRARKKLLEACARISALRKASAERLSEKMLHALKDLNFNEVQFRIDVRPEEERLSENGYDEVEFMISLNRGEEVKGLEHIASGGELSRIMLALKTVLADRDRVDTLIFDEIDTGISGRTAQKVAEKLKELSRSHQVICITHLPQIAAMADHHFMISKSEEDDRTITTVQELSEDASLEELSRLLSGAEITDAVRQNAAEMKRLARERV